MRRGKKRLRNKKSPMSSSSRGRCSSLSTSRRECAEKRANACLLQKPWNAYNTLSGSKESPSASLKLPFLSLWHRACPRLWRCSAAFLSPPCAEQRHGADCLQRALRSRFRQRLMPGVRFLPFGDLLVVRRRGVKTEPRLG